MKPTLKDLIFGIFEAFNLKIILYALLVVFLVISEGVIPELYKKAKSLFPEGGR